MRSRPILIALVLSFFTPGSGSAKTVPPGPLQAFYGEVTKVDLGAKTITLRLGSNLIFRITDETKITGPDGVVGLSKIRPGYGAKVVSRPGKANIGTAVTIRLVPKASFTGEASARTVRGETISGFAVNSLITYQPPVDAFSRGLDFGMSRSGMFLLAVQPDGSVASVKPLKSMGYGELDVRAAKWLMKWRFRPNSVTEVRMPATFSRILR